MNSKEGEKLQAFMNKRDIAAWMRSMSTMQMDACLELKSAIRDDGEQGTTYRVRKCLDTIGLQPIIKAKHLHDIIQLSRGCDLSFLYFLLECHYKSEGLKTYTANEQVLMTAIMNLDIQFTIRELDRILPLGHLSKKELLKLQKNRRNQCTSKMPPNQYSYIDDIKPKKKKSFILPYFEKLPRPKPIISRHICLKPEYQASFDFWKIGSPPEYQIHNEHRWFANYELQPSVRVVKQVISNVVENMLGQVNGSHTDMDSSVNGGEPILCEYHKFWLEQQKLFKNALALKARDRCFELIDVDARTNRRRREAIITQLEHDVEGYFERRKQLDELQYTYVQSLSESKCKLCVDLITTVAQKNNVKLISMENDIGTMASVTTDDVKKITKKIPNVDHFADVDMKSNAESQSGNCKNDEQPDKKIESKKKCLPRLVGMENSCKNAKVCLLDAGANGEKQRRWRTSFVKEHNHKFFNAPTEFTPSKFDYKYIYPPTLDKNIIDISTIRKYFIKALKRKDYLKREHPHSVNSMEIDKCLMEMSQDPMNSSVSSEPSSSVSETFEYDRTNLVNTIVQCAEFICTKRTEEFKLESRKNVEQSSPGEQGAMKDGRLDYGTDYFDPNDSELMEKLLKDGLAELAKDKRFVYASFPDSHKLALLRKWIRRRFGKVYTNKELLDYFNESFLIFQAVIANLKSSVPLDMHEMPSEAVYTRVNEMWKIAKHIKKRYYKKLNDDLMQDSTYCWFAMGAFLVPSGPPRNTFFAYMPARHKDIVRVNPWNGQARNYKLLRYAQRNAE